MYNYFPHPSNLRQSSGCVSLLIEEGYAGYGLYLSILEVLRDAPNYRYNPEPKVWRYLLHGDDTDQIERVLKNYGLFDIDDDGLLFSPWLMGQLNEYDEKRKAAAEAGRRGAAKRWNKSEIKGNGDAIATPLEGNGDAIATNTKYNKTKQNEILPNIVEGSDWRDIVAMDSKVVGPDFLDAMCHLDGEGKNYGYIAQVCMQYRMSENVCSFLCKLMDGASMSHPLYRKFCEIVKRIQKEKFTPNQPANFFLSKLTE